MSSPVIDDAASRQIGEYSQKLRESLAGIDLQGVDIFDVLTSDLWNKAFSDLDKMAVDDMIQLIHQLELHWAKLKLDPSELEALRDRIEKITEEIRTTRILSKDCQKLLRSSKVVMAISRILPRMRGISGPGWGSMFDSVTGRPSSKWGMAWR